VALGAGPLLTTVVGRARLSLDLKLPDKPVRRRVRGVEMLLPRRHALPYLTRPGSPYVQNLVDLAGLISDQEGKLCFLDIGANVGDSAAFVLDRTPATVVCVEPDPVWLEYLRTNLGSRPDVAIEESIVVGPELDADGSFAIVHADVGTSHVRESSDGDGQSAITTDELLRRHPQLGGVRLVKTDTDGFDVMLVPALMNTFAASRPVIFFEFDPRPTLLAMPDLDPKALWKTLDDAGYSSAVVWDNGGRLIGPAPTSELRERSAVLDLTQQERGYGFWDVAVAHRDDPVGLSVLEQLGRGV